LGVGELAVVAKEAQAASLAGGDGLRQEQAPETALLRALGSAAGPFEAVRQAANGRAPMFASVHQII